MKLPRSGSGVIRLFGYLIFGFGILSTIQYLVFINVRDKPIDMGIGLGNGAIALIGLVAVAVATCLSQIEKRLDQLESQGKPSSD